MGNNLMRSALPFQIYINEIQSSTSLKTDFSDIFRGFKTEE